MSYILAKYVPKTGTRPGFPRVPYPLVTHMDRFAQKIGGSRLGIRPYYTRLGSRKSLLLLVNPYI